MAKQDEMRVFAGMVAAAGPVVAKQIPLRIPPTNLSGGLRPSTPADLPHLLNGGRKSNLHRVARLSTAALLYSVDKSRTATPSRVLDVHERNLLEDLCKERLPRANVERTCPHCRLLFKTVYDDLATVWNDASQQNEPKRPPIAVINHSARVNITFDPESGVSQARIDNHQIIVPKSIALQLIEWSHPLRWVEPPGSMFQKCDPVTARGELLALGSTRDQMVRGWRGQTAKFIHEKCVWPVNENISTISENIIAFENLSNDDEYSLSYKYRLQRSLRSNFGVGWERTGFDVDGGFYQALAVPVGEFRDKASDELGKDNSGKIPDGPLTRIPTGQLKRRDVLELWSRIKPEALQNLYDGSLPPDAKKQDSCKISNEWYLPPPPPKPGGGTTVITSPGTQVGVAEPIDSLDPDATDRDQVAEAITAVAADMISQWGNSDPFYVVNISASKRLHFTQPDNGPIELWQLMTWMAPAFLFAFLNSAICLAPHVMVRNKFMPVTRD